LLNGLFAGFCIDYLIIINILSLLFLIITASLQLLEVAYLKVVVLPFSLLAQDVLSDLPGYYLSLLVHLDQLLSEDCYGCLDQTHLVSFT